MNSKYLFLMDKYRMLKLLLQFIAVFQVFSLYPQVSSDWIDGVKGAIYESIKFTADFAVNDTTVDRVFTENKSCIQVYYYDRKNTMYRVENGTGEIVDIKHSALHKNFVGLLNTNRKNVYLSQLFEAGNGYYYFTGKHVLTGFVLILFNIDKTLFPDKKFVIFNSKGDKLINNGFSNNELKVKSDIIVNKKDQIEQNSIYTFNLTDNSDKLFITYQN